MAVTYRLATLLAVVVAVSASPIALRQIPVDAINITVFHVNQANYSGLANMNSADVGGDAFFKFRTAVTEQMCQNPDEGFHYPGMCSNPEQFSNDLVVTKVVLAVSPIFGDYSECNVCTNGTIPFTRPPKTCAYGSYGCNCGGWMNPQGVCTPPVGRQNITEMFNRMPIHHMDTLTYWMKNLVDRTSGMWYSTLDVGECGGPKMEKCDWAIVETIKRINATCLDNSVNNVLYSSGSACFSGCGSQARNESSSCYAKCFYDTLLGTDCGSNYPCSGGMSREEIFKLWDDAMAQCPPV
eukprot:m.54495 g.54495  ORF g.54495 m.54495 type:complete len:296 (+) comp10931_c1_seq3:1338-2225(+)